MSGVKAKQGLLKGALFTGALSAVFAAGVAIAAGQTNSQAGPIGLTPGIPPRTPLPPVGPGQNPPQLVITGSPQDVISPALVAQIKAATTPDRVNDLIAAASVSMTPAQIGRLVSAAVAAHNNFATSIVSAATAAHPNAVNQIAAAAIAALPEGQRLLASQSILNAAATAANVNIVQVTAALLALNPSLVLTQSVGFGYTPNPVAPPGVTALHPSIAYTYGSPLLSALSSNSPPGAFQSPANTGTDAITVEPPATDPSKGGSGSPT